MNLKQLALAAGVAVVALGATVATSFAADAYATGSVNVRSGPGTQYRVIDVLHRGDAVDVDYCRGTWCATDVGWVSANYLTRDDFYDDDYFDDGPDVRFFVDHPRHYRHYRHYRNDPFASFCVGGPNARFCVSN